MPSRKHSFTAEKARIKIAEKLHKAGEKGVAGFVTAKTSDEQRAIYDEALEEMVTAGSVARISVGAKLKYFASEFAPSAERVAARIEEYAALKHPVVLAQAGFGKALSSTEKPFLGEALQLLLAQVRLVKLNSGKAFVYAHAGSLREMLGSGVAHVTLPKSAAPSPVAPRSVEPQRIRDAYRSLVKRTGFPDVEISALGGESGDGMAELKGWLLAEHANGRANFSLGDWSLASELERAGAIELRDQRYLLVRLED